MILFLDTETTGLPRPQGSDLSKQPYITEVCFIQTNDKLKVKENFTTLVKPPIPIPEHITKITGLTDDDVKDAPSFREVFKHIKKLFKVKDTHTLVAHNYSFDYQMLCFEAERINKQFKFPPNKFCTVEQSLHIKGRRLKLSEIYELATGQTSYGAHRAENDVMAMIQVYRYIMEAAK